MIIFIGCVKKKENYPTYAQDLYKSTYFKYCLSYAKKLNPTKIYILSAYYGVLELTDIIAPYEKTLNNMNIKERKEWSKKVLKQLLDKKIDFEDETLFLCGKKYREYLEPYFINCSSPFKNLNAIGKQLQFLKENI